MKSTYSEKLKDPRWQKARLKSLEAAGWTCQSCGAGEISLHVHHKQYVKGREVWEYTEDELAVLCETCHSICHEFDDIAKDLVANAPYDGPSNKRDLVFLMAGFVGREITLPLPSDKYMYELGVAASDSFLNGYKL